MTKLFLCVLIFSLTYGVYHLSLFPSVSGGDSGEKAHLQP